mmetsp:Transcript_18955/g.24446  ORF Transcript_18955/g.24446 Transcript_18955/m.24446 type:complete len:95 (+) Transcript_18955:378-662(+)
MNGQIRKQVNLEAAPKLYAGTLNYWKARLKETLVALTKARILGQLIVLQIILRIQKMILIKMMGISLPISLLFLILFEQICQIHLITHIVDSEF